MTRSSEANFECACTLCDTGRLKLQGAVSHSKEHSNPVGAPSTHPQGSKPVAVKLCSECFSEIGPGKPHQCSKTVKRDNIASLVRNTSEKSMASVAVSALKDIANQQGASNRGGRILLSSGAKLLPVVVGSRHGMPPVRLFSHQALMNMQTELNLSDSSTL